MDLKKKTKPNTTTTQVNNVMTFLLLFTPNNKPIKPDSPYEHMIHKMYLSMTTISIQPTSQTTATTRRFAHTTLASKDLPQFLKDNVISIHIDFPFENAQSRNHHAFINTCVHQIVRLSSVCLSVMSVLGAFLILRLQSQSVVRTFAFFLFSSIKLPSLFLLSLEISTN